MALQLLDIFEIAMYSELLFSCCTNSVLNAGGLIGIKMPSSATYLALLY
jgi:hypothetical protein